MRFHAVHEGTERRGDGDIAHPAPLRFTDIRVVQPYAFRDTQTPACPGRGKREVVHRWERIRKVLKQKGRFMAENPRLLAPQPEHDEVLMLACWIVGETEDSPAGPLDATAFHVMGQQGQ
ncbi:hypothetical protein Q664_20730 [Archangium violaceum Cb vi76]|uniref:Uncharacterized protein n=1 Tax=Archangium violaceum Cb vi76 TaxID=1406225 RepID=A0A084ST30_9BACT|nr:hypothetical protein Q664_20730 [Archangium violaceum Cb vi76]